MESFKALYEEKRYFYLNQNNNNNRIPELEEMRIKSISKTYHLDNVYYDLDHHNIFKRTDRYKYKIFLIFVFTILVCFNLFEIIFNIFSLIHKKKSESYSESERIVTSIISLINILVTLVLSSFTVIKMKIQSSILY